MEIDGHPTQDLIEELERRGAMRVGGTSAGPSPDTLRFVLERVGDVTGFWMFVPPQTFLTGVDEIPPPG
ncbi:MAG: hypothetical protein ACRDJL_03685 [Actinomycetota bacterium]